MVGSWSLFFLVMEAISLYLSEFFLDEKDIDIIRYFDSRSYGQDPQRYGEPQFQVHGKQASDFKIVDHDTKNEQQIDQRHPTGLPKPKFIFDRTMRYDTPVPNKNQSNSKIGKIHKQSIRK